MSTQTYCYPPEERRQRTHSVERLRVYSQALRTRAFCSVFSATVTDSRHFVLQMKLRIFARVARSTLRMNHALYTRSTIVVITQAESATVESLLQRKPKWIKKRLMLLSNGWVFPTVNGKATVTAYHLRGNVQTKRTKCSSNRQALAWLFTKKQRTMVERYDIQGSEPKSALKQERSPCIL